MTRPWSTRSIWRSNPVRSWGSSARAGVARRRPFGCSPACSTPTSGTATIDGVPAHHLTSKQRSRIGYLPQSPALFGDLSVWENLNFHASMYGLALRRGKRLRQLLEWVELSDDGNKRVRDTSGGMQRRLALAATFVHDPSYLFLDEPTAGIDPILREKFWTQFRTLAGDGRTLLVTTQYVGEASFCDYVGLLSDGELLMFDTPQNLRRAAFDGEVIDVVLQRAPTDDQLANLAANAARHRCHRASRSGDRPRRRPRRRRGHRRDQLVPWARSASNWWRRRNTSSTTTRPSCGSSSVIVSRPRQAVPEMASAGAAS